MLLATCASTSPTTARTQQPVVHRDAADPHGGHGEQPADETRPDRHREDRGARDDEPLADGVEPAMLGRVRRLQDLLPGEQSLAEGDGRVDGRVVGGGAHLGPRGGSENVRQECITFRCGYAVATPADAPAAHDAAMTDPTVPPIVTAHYSLVSMSVPFMRSLLARDLVGAATEIGAAIPSDLPDRLDGFLQFRLADLAEDPAAQPWLGRAIVATGGGRPAGHRLGRLPHPARCGRPGGGGLPRRTGVPPPWRGHRSHRRALRLGGP